MRNNRKTQQTPREKISKIRFSKLYVLTYTVNEFEEEKKAEPSMKLPSVLRPDKPDSIYSHRKIAI